MINEKKGTLMVVFGRSVKDSAISDSGDFGEYPIYARAATIAAFKILLNSQIPQILIQTFIFATKIKQMALPNIFDKAVSDSVIERINKLTPSTQPQWGKMDVARMLAHCNVTYELVYENIHAKPKGIMKLVLKLLVKNSVVSETPYKHNLRTGPQFLIVDAKVFDAEKKRLISYITRVQSEGTKSFEGKASHSFGPLNTTEWNNMFYKHIDHHLRQFGV